MPQVSFCESAEKLHAPLAMMARSAIEGLAGRSAVRICDIASPLEARRRDDLLLVLERSEHNALVREGNRVTISYADPFAEASLGALIAGMGSHGAPVFAEPESLAILALARRLAMSDIPVLIGGPTGTGKEVLSRFIHQGSAA